MGVLFFGLLPLPGLLGVTAFLGGLAIVLVLHARREQPWRSLLVRAGVGLVTMWLAVTAASLTLLDRFGGGPLDGAPTAAANARALLAMILLAAVLLLVIAGGLLGWIASASRPRVPANRA